MKKKIKLKKKSTWNTRFKINKKINSNKNSQPIKNSKLNRLKKISNIFFYIIIIGFISSILLISYFSKKIQPSLTKYAVSETKRITTLIINNSIDNNSSKVIDYESILEIERDNNNEIKMIDFNTNKVNEILENINNQIQYNIKQVELGNLDNLDDYMKGVSEIDYEKIEDGIVYYIPFGNISGNILTNNLGPKIPIKFGMSGDVVSSIKSDIKEYGINNAMIEVDVLVTVTMIINMPFVSKSVKVDSSIPITMKIIQGTIPDYYLSPTN